MYAVQFNTLKKALLCSFVLVGISSQPLWAGQIIDLQKHHPLGTILKSKTGNEAYFSLGNGRALQIQLAQSGKLSRVRLENLLLKDNDEGRKTLPVRRRNLKW